MLNDLLLFVEVCKVIEFIISLRVDDEKTEKEPSSEEREREEFLNCKVSNLKDNIVNRSFVEKFSVCVCGRHGLFTLNRILLTPAPPPLYQHTETRQDRIRGRKFHLKGH